MTRGLTSGTRFVPPNSDGLQMVWKGLSISRLVLAVQLAIASTAWSAFAGETIKRVRWAGMHRQSHAPHRLNEAVKAHLAIVLRQMDIAMTDEPPFEAAASAACVFRPSERGAKKRAVCSLRIDLRSGTNLAKQQVTVPYRDVDDLAQTLALLTGNMLSGGGHEHSDSHS